MDQLLTALKAAAEPTRLRLLALCGYAELSVSELTQILGQSQPRVSRHLKMLCDADLLERSREGTWAFFRLADAGPMADLARTLIDAIPTDDDTTALDLERLDAVKRQRDETAARYFGKRRHAGTRSARCTCPSRRSRMRCSRCCRAGSRICSTSAPAPAGCSSCSRRG